MSYLYSVIIALLVFGCEYSPAAKQPVLETKVDAENHQQAMRNQLDVIRKKSPRVKAIAEQNTASQNTAPLAAENKAAASKAVTTHDAKDTPVGVKQSAASETPEKAIVVKNPDAGRSESTAQQLSAADVQKTKELSQMVKKQIAKLKQLEVKLEKKLNALRQQDKTDVASKMAMNQPKVAGKSPNSNTEMVSQPEEKEATLSAIFHAPAAANDQTEKPADRRVRPGQDNNVEQMPAFEGDAKPVRLGRNVQKLLSDFVKNRTATANQVN